MTYEELQQCELPLKVVYATEKGDITAFNRAGFLFTAGNEDFNCDIDELDLVNTGPTKVKLYRYMVRDKARNESYKSAWTTEEFEDVYPQNGNFTYTSYEQKIVEIE